MNIMRKGTILAVVLGTAIGWFIAGFCIGNAIPWDMRTEVIEWKQ